MKEAKWKSGSSIMETGVGGVEHSVGRSSGGGEERDGFT